jgi:hypothetical protein
MPVDGDDDISPIFIRLIYWGGSAYEKTRELDMIKRENES